MRRKKKQTGSRGKSPMIRWSIRSQLIFLLSFISAVPLILFAVVSQLRLQTVFEESMEGRVEAGLEKAGQGLNITLDKYEELLYDVCTDDELIAMVERVNADPEDVEEADISLRRKLNHLCNRNDGVEALTIFTANGGCIYYDRLASSSKESTWIDESINLLGDDLLMYQPVRYAAQMGDRKVYVFSIQRKLIDYRDIHRNIGSVVVSVNETVLRQVMEPVGDEFYYLEYEGRVISAPVPYQIGYTISTVNGTGGQIGGREYENYRVASAYNEKTGWNMVEYYSLSLYQKAAREQVLLLIVMAAGEILVLVGAIVIFTGPVVSFVVRMCGLMRLAGQGEFSVRMEKFRQTPSEMVEIAEGFNEMMDKMDTLLKQVRSSAEEQKNAEIYALEAQIDPHFLYNTLDTINWKAIAREEYEISDMLGDLGDILRYAIRNAGGVTTLGQEIAWLKKYIRLQQEKLGRKIQVFTNLDEQLAQYPIHKLLLQPFVENSIKYGLLGIEREPLLIVTVTVSADYMEIILGDNGKGIKAETVERLNQAKYHMKDHFGIENARKRLYLYYGENAGIRFESCYMEYTRVYLKIPLQEKGVIKDENRDSGG